MTPEPKPISSIDIDLRSHDLISLRMGEIGELRITTTENNAGEWTEVSLTATEVERLRDELNRWLGDD